MLLWSPSTIAREYPSLPGNGEAHFVEIEQTAAIARVYRLRVQVVADAEIQRQPLRDLPIVLEENAEIDVALPAPVEHLCPLNQAREAHQVIGEWRAGTGRIAAGREDRSEDELPEERIAAQIVVAVAAEVGADLHVVLAAR